MRIVVVPLKQIGDCIVALPICESLKKTYPHAEIDIVLYDPITGIAENTLQFQILLPSPGQIESSLSDI